MRGQLVNIKRWKRTLQRLLTGSTHCVAILDDAAAAAAAAAAHLKMNTITLRVKAEMFRLITVAPSDR